MPALILASTSAFRRALLERLGLPFTTAAPDTDETPLPGEPPPTRALRLAEAKARAVAGHDNAAHTTIVVGSDQVAACDGQILRKPGTPERTLEQLSRCQGRCVDFFTAAAVIRGTAVRSHLDHTRVVFRSLPRSSLEYYITRDEPFACAGGFKAEGLGIALFERIESHDPTALIGLPLIWLTGALRDVGLDPLAAQ